MLEDFGVNVGKVYGFSFKDYSRWFVDIAGLSGWGQFEWQDIDEEKRKGLIIVKNSPVADSLRNKVNSPCDHIIRGFVAGAASSAFKEDINIIEIECEALGAQGCKFVMGRLEDLK